jgi:hypothetical protein
VKRAVLSLVALLLAGFGTQARALQREHIPMAREIARGELVPIAPVIARLRGRMHGHRYIGVEYIPEARRYRVKFIRSRDVVWIDIDARTGRIIGTAHP